MKKIVLLISIVLITSVGYSYDRFLWCWFNDSVTNNIGTARQDLFNFCAAPFGDTTKAVTVLYYSTSLSSTTTNLRNFLTAAHNKGLKILYLDGTWTWVTSERTLSEGKATMDRLIHFNEINRPNQRFDGVQYDVEPDYDVGFFTHKAEWWNRYLTLLAYCQSKVKTYNLHYSPPIYFETAESYYYGTDGDPITTNISIQTTINSVAVMNYFNTVTKLTANGIQFLKCADTTGRKVVIGLEVSNEPKPPLSSFYGLGNLSMESTLAICESVYITHPSYQGIAFEYYEPYRNLKSKVVESNGH